MIIMRSWKNNKTFADFRFKSDSTENFSDVENEVLKRIHSKIVADHLVSSISPNGIIRGKLHF